MSAEVFYRAMGLPGYWVVDVWESRGGEIELLVERPLRTVFGEHSFARFVYAVGPQRNIELQPIDARLGLPENKYSYLLQEFSQCFCIEQAFDQASLAFEKVFAQRLPVDSLERINRRMGVAAEQYLCDGQETLWDAAASCTELADSDAIEILNLLHVSSYLWRCMSAAICGARRAPSTRATNRPRGSSLVSDCCGCCAAR